MELQDFRCGLLSTADFLQNKIDDGALQIALIFNEH